MPIKLEDLIPGGKAENTPKKGVNRYELEKGIKVEMEHTDSKAKAEEIARDHLAENPAYYSKLEKAGLADELDESKVGDMYISIGEAIEEIEGGYKKLEKLIKPMNLKPGSPENQNLYKLKHAIIDLKTMFGDSYEFQSNSKKPVELYKMDVMKLIDYLDSLSTFSKYRDLNAQYDDEYYMDVPQDLLVRYGLTDKVLSKIQSNTEEYGGNIMYNTKKNTISITGWNE